MAFLLVIDIVLLCLFCITKGAKKGKTALAKAIHGGIALLAGAAVIALLYWGLLNRALSMGTTMSVGILTISVAAMLFSSPSKSLAIGGIVFAAAVAVVVGLRVANGSDWREDAKSGIVAETRWKSGKAKTDTVGKPMGKIEKIRDFALREAPSMWEAYQRLGTEIDVQAHKIEDLKKEIVGFGRDPNANAGFNQLVFNLEDMRRMRDSLMKKMEAAFLAKAKYDATPGHGDTEALWKKAQEDGIQEAEAAERRFLEMKESKQDR